MHPTGAASLPAAPEAEVQAMHSMDWLFKKERIYLLAQFWQQVMRSRKRNTDETRAPDRCLKIDCACTIVTDKWTGPTKSAIAPPKLSMLLRLIAAAFCPTDRWASPNSIAAPPTD
ncbi:unnamed protein product, partial [Iphiclides podalirius]